MKSLVRMFILLPVLTLVWGVANSLGITTAATRAVGLPDIDIWRIPGVPQLVEAREQAGKQAGRLRDEARRAVLRSVKDEVRERFGPKAARLVPEDLTLRQARSFDFDDFARTMGVDHMGRPLPTARAATIRLGSKARSRARAQLAGLPTKGRAPTTGYSRDAFGPSWSDAVTGSWASRNGCDTRNDILARDLSSVTFKSDTGQCKVLSGVLAVEPFTGQSDVVFDPASSATQLDIDHLVSLSDAWQKGAQALSPLRRAQLANDPDNLLAVDPGANRSKGDADFATWQPPHRAYRARYAAKQVAVKAKYGLWVTTAERAALERALR